MEKIWNAKEWTKVLTVVFAVTTLIFGFLVITQRGENEYLQRENCEIRQEISDLRSILAQIEESLNPTKAKDTYIVQPGDNLAGIAKFLLGDASKWHWLAEINQISNPNLIFPNQILIWRTR